MSKEVEAQTLQTCAFSAALASKSGATPMCISFTTVFNRLYWLPCYRNSQRHEMAVGKKITILGTGTSWRAPIAHLYARSSMK